MSIIWSALYGLVESARLWYEKLSGDLRAIGFKVNLQDMCVFNRIEANGKQTTIVLHVDDMMITACDEAMIDKLIDELQINYKNLSIKRGRVLNYLGMTFDFTNNGKVKVTMSGYINDLLKEYDYIEGECST